MLPGYGAVHGGCCEEKGNLILRCDVCNRDERISEWFNQEIIPSAAKTGKADIKTGSSGDENDGHILPNRIGTYETTYLKPTNMWHENINQHGIGFFFINDIHNVRYSVGWQLHTAVRRYR